MGEPEQPKDSGTEPHNETRRERQQRQKQEALKRHEEEREAEDKLEEAKEMQLVNVHAAAQSRHAEAEWNKVELEQDKFAVELLRDIIKDPDSTAEEVLEARAQLRRLTLGILGKRKLAPEPANEATPPAIARRRVIPETPDV